MSCGDGPPAGSFPSLQSQLSLESTLHSDLNRSEWSPSCSSLPDARRVSEYKANPYIKDTEATGLVDQEKHLHQYRIYRRRWFGLVVLTLQSLAIGWGFTAPGVITETATAWYGISFQEINNLYIVENLVFILPAPFVIWVLNRAGPKKGILVSCLLAVIGNWVIYVGARTQDFTVNMVGVVIHGLAAPFALCAPTRYSRQWFGDNSRTFATAIPSLAYPLGSGIGAITAPYMVKPIGLLDYDMQALVIACVCTAVALPAPFLPHSPPTPPSVVAAEKMLPVRESIRLLSRNKAFYLQLVTFMLIVGAIDAACAVTVQAVQPYGYTQREGANAIAFLIFVGIGAALIVCPVLDRTGQHESFLKGAVVVIAIAYTGLPWIPDSHSVAALYVTYAIIGACSLSLEPVSLEYQASVTHPVSPEFASVVCWCCCRVSSSVFTLLVGNVLVSHEAEEGQPKASLFNGLLLVAGLAWLGAVCTMFNGVWIFKQREASKARGNG